MKPRMDDDEMNGWMDTGYSWRICLGRKLEKNLAMKQLQQAMFFIIVL